MSGFGVTEVDYGEQGPEDFDRFGARHYVRITARHRSRTFLDADPHAIIKRLGLTLLRWRTSWPRLEIFDLEVWGRPLQIRSYSDGRIKLFLDGEPVYTENTKVVLRHGVRYREVAIWQDPAVDDEESRQRQAEERKARLDAVRANLTTKTEA